MNDKGVAHADPVGMEISVTSPLIKSHPLATVTPHRCPIITKDLEVIQKALVVANVAKEDGYTIVIKIPT